MKISIEPTIHNFTIYKNMKNIEMYNQFINWLKGEFDLYLMEELDGLKVYYPNGFFLVSLFSKNENDLSIEIKIMSRTLKTANQISAKIDTIYIRLNNVVKKNLKLLQGKFQNSLEKSRNKRIT